MGRMSTIALMLDEGASVNAIAEQLQQWNRSIDRRTALEMACKYMQEWRAHAQPKR